ncbi:MAG: PAS domain S-box protein [Anaerolineae bacterium]
MTRQVIHVLSIEDNPADAALIQTLLAEGTRMGWDLPPFEVERAESVSAGLERLKGGDIDVVLTDLDLPDSREGGTVATLREHIPHLPLVVLTGQEDESMARESVRAGVQDYLYKDEVTGSLLARTLLYAIERQQAHARLERRVAERTTELRQANEALEAEIAERKEIEEALQDREKHYQSLFKDAPISIWEEDSSEVKKAIDALRAAGVRDFPAYFHQHPEVVQDLAAKVRVLAVNRRTLEIYEAESASDFYGGLSDIFGKSSYEETLCVIAEGGTEFQSEKTDRTLKGNEIEVELRWKVVPGYEATYSKVLVSITNITHRRRAEERMRHLNRVLSAIRNVNQLITRETNRERLLQGACDNLTETRGYEHAWIALIDEHEALVVAAESGLGDDFSPLVERLEQGTLTTCGKCALAQAGVVSIADPPSACPNCPLARSYDDSGAMFIRLEHRGKIYGWLTVSVPRPFIDLEEERDLLQEVAGDIAFALHDIELKEARRRAEQALTQHAQALRESEERFRIVLENLPAGLFAHDTAGRILLVNEAACRNTGYSRSELLTMSVADIDPTSVTREDRIRLWHTLETGKFTTFKATHVRKDGSQYPAEVHLTAITMGGEPVMLALATDITARKRTEEALTEVEKRFRRIVELSPIGVGIVDSTGALIDCNAALAEIVGYSREELLELSFADFTHPEDLEREWQLIHQMWEDQRNEYRMEKRYLHKEGHTVWVAVTASIFKGDTETSAFGFAFVQDITKRKRAEEALRKSEKKFRTLIENVVDWVWQVDTDGVYTYVSPQVEKIMGYPVSEILGKTPFDFMTPQEAARVGAIFATIAARRERIVGLEDTLIARDGREILFETNATPMFDAQGEFTGYMGTCRDITERKRSEEALRESEAKMRSIFRVAPIGIGVVCDRIFMAVNERLCEIVGYARDELIGRDARILYPTDEDYEYVGREKYRQIGERGTGRVETRFRHKDGRIIDVLLSSTPLDLSDLSAGVTFTVLNITERKQAEAQIKHYAAELERSNQDLEHFAYVVSHDLQEPARMVKSYLNLLEQSYYSELDEEARELIAYAMDGAERMQAMIRALLDLSRVETRGVDFAPVDCNLLVRNALDDLTLTIEERGADVTHDPLPIVMADQAQLTQVFQNLVGNAIKFRREDEAPRVHISAQQEDDQWIFSVEDNGIGVDPNQKERIFQIFQRLHTQEEYPGIGIGLALCRRIVERHGGRIWVESEPGQGSTFYFTLPA